MAIATKQEVREALAECRVKDEATYTLIEMVQKYFELRGKYDPDFDHYVSHDALEDGIDFYDEGYLTIQWSERDRCGNHDYFNEIFPVEHLWSDEWEEEAKKLGQVRREREERERQERQRREAEALEKRERLMLRTLMKKYPDEVTRRTGGA